MKVRNELFLVLVFIILTFGLSLQGVNRFYLENYFIEEERGELLLIGDILTESYDPEEVATIESLNGVKIKKLEYSDNKDNFILGIYFSTLEVDDLLEGNLILTDRVTKNDVRILVYGNYLPETSEFLIITSHIDKITNSVNIYRQFTVKVVGIIFIMGLIFAYLFSRRITKPIIELEDVAKRISRLDFSTAINPNGNGEVKSLGESLEIMRTRLKRTHLELNYANVQLKEELEKEKEIDKMRRRFIAGVNHELKTPITVISSYAFALKRKLKADEDLIYYCDVISDESTKMEKMVNRLLYLSKIENGFFESHIIDIDLDEEISSLLIKYSKISKEKNIKISSDLVPMNIPFDKDQLEIILDNLTSNAFKYVTNTNEIKIRNYYLDDNIVIEYYNTCNPIDDVSINKLWNPFFILDKSRSLNGKSTGLGLSLVKKIIDNVNGTCFVENFDEGIIFKITIPVK